MPEIKATRLPHDPERAPLTPYPKKAGEFRFEDMDYRASEPPSPGEMGRFNYGCPRGTGTCGSILIGNGCKPDADRPTWHWDGNADAPTLTPSINCLAEMDGQKLAGCGWHGWLTSGVFKD